MSNNDPFADSAAWQAEEELEAYLGTEDAAYGFRDGFARGAEWARTHLAAQETDAEVEAAAIALYNDDESWGFVVEFAYGTQAVEWDDLGDGPQEMFREFARRALRAARRDEEKR